MGKKRITVDKEMAERIRKARKEKGYTQEGLLDHVNFQSVNTIKKIEEWKKDKPYKTTVETLMSIASALDVSFEYIVGDLYRENSEKWAEYLDRLNRVQANNEPWIICNSGGGWDGNLDELNITCSNYDADKLVLAICLAGGMNLVLDGLRQYEEIRKRQK